MIMMATNKSWDVHAAHCRVAQCGETMVERARRSLTLIKSYYC